MARGDGPNGDGIAENLVPLRNRFDALEEFLRVREVVSSSAFGKHVFEDSRRARTSENRRSVAVCVVESLVVIEVGVREKHRCEILVVTQRGVQVDTAARIDEETRRSVGVVLLNPNEN
nr:hypothetical protein [Halogeometricum pallidum]